MPGGFQLPAQMCNFGNLGAMYNNGAPGVGLTAPSVADTYPATWNTIISSLATDIDFLMLQTFNYLNGSGVLQLGIGAAASEVSILDGLCLTTAFSSLGLYLPLSLPAGTRIAARYKNHAGGNNAQYLCLAYGQCSEPSIAAEQAFEVVGLTANSCGTTITGNATTNTLGPYTQLVAATANDWTGFYIVTDTINNTLTNANGAISIAIGAPGSEIELVRTMCTVGFRGVMEATQGMVIPWMFNIPAGSSLSAAYIADTASAIIGCSLIGIR